MAEDQILTKPFFEVFPGLKVNETLSDLFRTTGIAGIACNRERTRFRIRLVSGHLIHKKYIYAMADQLGRQIFHVPGKEIYFAERYALSAQYTPAILMKEYGDSLAEEFSHDSQVAGSCFRGAEFAYPEPDRIVVTLDDSCFARNLADEMIDALERVFRDRCGVPASFMVQFRPRTEEAERAGDAAGMSAAAPGTGISGQNGSSAGAVSGTDSSAGSAPCALDGAAGAAIADCEKGTSAAQAPGSPAAAGAPAAGRQAPSGFREAFGGDKKKERRGFVKGYYKRSENPDVIYGRDIEDKAVNIPISDIIGEIGEVTVHGQVLMVDRRDIRNNKTIVKFVLTDFTDSIYVKVFVGTEFADEFLGQLPEKSFVRVKGVSQMDSWDHEVIISSVTGIMKIPSFVTKRKDTAPRKRVELHCHTKMSDMDGVSECKDLVKQAYQWGWPAIAITDHGNVQAFPDANHLRQDLLKAENDRRKEAGEPPVDPQRFFKVIYGVECYLVDDLRPVSTYGTRETPASRIDERTYVVFDLETTGFSADNDRIIEIGAYKVAVSYEDAPASAGNKDAQEEKILTGRIIDEFTELVNPGIPIPYRIQQLTHIDDEMVLDKEKIDVLLPRFLQFSEGCVLVGHNVQFDIGFIRAKSRELGLSCDFSTVDTLGISRAELPGHGRYTLDAVAKILGVELDSHHRGSDDAKCTADIFIKLLPMLQKDKVETFGALNALTASNPEVVKHMNPLFHCILLAKNTTGRTNLYTLISKSHLTYYNRKPRIPKSELVKYREGLIIGSACVQGELFQAILEDRSEEVVSGIAKFYDYLEIQPVANNRFLIGAVDRDGGKRYPKINSDEDLEELNRRIVRLGEALGKPVVATCDVHFKDPEDEIFRTILQDGLGMSDEEPAPLYLRTTDEMLQEFSYLGPKKCEEVVITNPNRIADRIEALSPVRPDKCPPVIPHSDEMLREICYRKAHEMYGDPLPKIVGDRLERELTSIIKNGYSVMYIIAQKLVWKSVEDGYLVGSRGSVGSSFVATMAGITEVNPLPPHYLCPKCHYSDFDSDLVKSYQLKTGIDLPPAVCPHCGAPLEGLGFGIPFETFLGFNGDKEPDIDLNFSGEYQAKAHAYTKVIFGHEQTFKAGTIATVAEKTAYGYVKNYYERKGVAKRTCEIDRLLQGIVGVRRSTGQHPGGIVVLPVGEDINSFTPVQHPANDMTTDIITTHFDYHSIDHNLLKLDILGHDDPTMIRMLQDLTGIDPMTIPLNDPDVMSLFRSTEALGVTPEQIGTNVGTLGIPEFGTKFVMGMLEDTEPSTMSELLKISGLSHGTDVWLGNAQDAIAKGYCTLATCIGCRDDIMMYLLSVGMEPGLAFKTMESVRKGRGLKDNMIDAMKKCGVPQWYIDCCWKIKYMFPKGHAAAYVMMALRVAYMKVHRPLAYYCAYFSIRATNFDYELMAQGEQHLDAVIADLKAKEKRSPKEDDLIEDAKLVKEYYARGYAFLPIDLNTVKSRHFQIIDGKLMPSLTSINGMGEKAADAVVEAVKDGPFTSRDNFRSRTKVSQTNVDLMDKLGILGNLPESDQISLFDLLGKA